MLNNIDFINFCQNLLGAPYWFNASAIKATRNAYKVNSIRFPEEYGKKDISFYEKAIEEKEVVTDAVGLIKGYAWSNGGQDILSNRGNEIVHTYKVGSNGCPDKSANGMFIWATDENAKWGEIETLPNVPGLIVTYHGHLGVYEGNGYVIEANPEAGYVTREPISNKHWKFWYELPFIEYNECIKKKPEEIKEEVKEIKVEGIAIAMQDVLFREGRSENSKLNGIIKKDQQVSIFNDSTDTLLHILMDDLEGYAIAKYFIYYPKKPHRISDEKPNKFEKKLRGLFVTNQNIGLRNKAGVRANTYTVLPKDTEVMATGGISGDYAHVYVELKDKIYVGYIDKNYLKRVAYLEK